MLQVPPQTFASILGALRTSPHSCSASHREDAPRSVGDTGRVGRTNGYPSTRHSLDGRPAWFDRNPEPHPHPNHRQAAPAPAMHHRPGPPHRAAPHPTAPIKRSQARVFGFKSGEHLGLVGRPSPVAALPATTARPCCSPTTTRSCRYQPLIHSSPGFPS